METLYRLVRTTHELVKDDPTCSLLPFLIKSKYTTLKIEAVRARGFRPADDNEADAIALLLWAIETNGGVA